MHIMIVTQVFPPEFHPTAVMVSELARALQDRGAEVTVVTGFPHHPHGRLYPGFALRPLLRENRDGLTVLRTMHLLSPKRDIGHRALVLLCQAMANALGAALVGPHPDILITYGPPLLGPMLQAAVSRLRQTRFVNVIFDIYPDIAVETGHLKNPLIIGMARAAEALQHQAADLTVVLSEGFRRVLLGKGVPADRLEVIPLWLDPEEIRPGPRCNAWRDEQGISPEKRVVLYAGTVGLVSGARVVAEAAALVRDRPELLFVFNGEGEARPEVERRARELDLHNILFLPFQPRERLPEVQATADIGLVTLSPGRGRTSVPSKVLGYMAAGRPVLASVDADSDTGLEVSRFGLGLVVPPADPRALADGVVRLLDEPGLAERCGVAARERLVQGYAREAVLERYYHLLLGLLDGSRGPDRRPFQSATRP